ncbi:hypothetical protein T492DRAFT_982026 [Pavlovales sp. CCMP2436]|nr:hypothetical protein T492DRAFT_982026 [Pavlovales sp. CCMP2436]|mmetsp:Transcript_43994/g.108933  ORF Transcript_43994/g.108933 Transcript_43994/m.108933 type:complete len:179 (-) Transcript_43994:155-691(-)
MGKAAGLLLGAASLLLMQQPARAFSFATPSCSAIARRRAQAPNGVRLTAPVDGGGGVFHFGSFTAADTRVKWADPKVKARVIRALIDALDNFRPAEVALIVDRLWSGGPTAGAEGVSVQRLIELTEQIEQLELLAYEGRADMYELGDEARTVRSRMRMYARDAKLYPGDKNMPFLDLL